MRCKKYMHIEVTNAKRILALLFCLDCLDCFLLFNIAAWRNRCCLCLQIEWTRIDYVVVLWTEAVPAHFETLITVQLHRFVVCLGRVEFGDVVG